MRPTELTRVLGSAGPDPAAIAEALRKSGFLSEQALSDLEAVEATIAFAQQKRIEQHRQQQEQFGTPAPGGSPQDFIEVALASAGFLSKTATNFRARDSTPFSVRIRESVAQFIRRLSCAGSAEEKK